MKKKQSSSIVPALKVELAKAGLNQSQLARKLEVPSTTLSDWLRGEHPAPADLPTRIEKALGLSAGALSGKEVSDGR